MKSCPNCQMQVSEDDNFCTNCGEKLNSEKVTVSSSSANEKKENNSSIKEKIENLVDTDSIKENITKNVDINSVKDKIKKSIDIDNVKKNIKEIKKIRNVNDLKKNKKFMIGLTTVLVALLVVGIFAFKSSQSLDRVVPGHVYYLSDTNKYYTFGSGKNNSKMIIFPDKKRALETVASEKLFNNYHKEDGNQPTVDNVKFGFDSNNESYNVTDNNLTLRWTSYSLQANTPDTSGSSSVTVGGLGSALISSFVTPIIQQGVSAALTTDEVVSRDESIKVTDIKVKGVFTHKLEGYLERNGKKEKVTLTEVKETDNASSSSSSSR